MRLPWRRPRDTTAQPAAPSPRRRGPLTRVHIDLDRLPGNLDAAAGRELLPMAPGVVDVQAPPQGHHAMVVFDASTSQTELWNWLRERARSSTSDGATDTP